MRWYYTVTCIGPNKATHKVFAMLYHWLFVLYYYDKFFYGINSQKCTTKICRNYSLFFSSYFLNYTNKIFVVNDQREDNLKFCWLINIQTIPISIKITNLFKLRFSSIWYQLKDLITKTPKPQNPKTPCKWNVRLNKNMKIIYWKNFSNNHR